MKISRNEIPLRGTSWRHSLGGDEGEFEKVRSDDLELGIADGRERKGSIDGGGFVGQGDKRQGAAGNKCPNKTESRLFHH